ncbi:uncharacterized protein BO66DRAFT_223440 [Aspergillus aculeatinus CBS 121060]|uniref:Uncharacterized protein n=1 Tax=Aspergillus aculeatinus CBS 121060 TaxID=1448322 RepID=A0ACD1HJE7_9EURO|nr:hypothetical protein BO66DRAFT_223440 [Aspergillus aculeatinus CBS 121060]RAH73483.1 hypothetical protein BO66DRAFT_223440 [Aspergillus aculeatinus CBS 121060]
MDSRRPKFRGAFLGTDGEKNSCRQERTEHMASSETHFYKVISRPPVTFFSFPCFRVTLLKLFLSPSIYATWWRLFLFLIQILCWSCCHSPSTTSLH